MSKQTVTISNPSTLSVKNQQLVISQEKREATLPLEDIWVLIIETKFAKITSAALSELVNSGIGVMTCNETHHPNGLLLPIGAHSRHSAIVENQLTISAPLKKRLWQRIVQKKIQNQACCLEILNYEKSNKLQQLVLRVQSGDKNNLEAQAAQIYFSSLLPDGTRRDSSYTPALDYGYSIIRAGIARSAVSYGWLVSRGLHHDNALNAFNLVDDIIEPFRPIVDLMIASNPPAEGLTPKYKQYLTTCHEYCVLMNGKEFIVQNAINEVLESLKRAVIGNDYNLLTLPDLMPLKKKRYE